MCINRRRLFNKHLVMDKEQMKDFDFQKRIQNLMNAAGIKTQYELAARCNVDRSMVTKWMIPGRELRYPTIEKICGAFDITVSEFFDVGFVDRRGDGTTKRLRHIWKTLTETEKTVFLKVGKTAVEAVKPFIEDKDTSSLT